MKGTGTPVQCASSDVTVDPATGHMVLRDSTTTGPMYNSSAGGVDGVPPAPPTGRKLLSSQETQDGGRKLLQTSTSTQVAMTMTPICEWHSKDFYNSATNTWLTNTCRCAAVDNTGRESSCLFTFLE